MNGDKTRTSCEPLRQAEPAPQHMERSDAPAADKPGLRTVSSIRVFRGFDALPHFRHAVVTVGSFDGVHLGHRALLDRLTAEARARNGESIVLTFDPHPRVTLGRSEGLHLLTSLDEKIELLGRAGVDNVIVIPFDKAFSALSGREFAERYLLGRIGAEVLVAGYDHRFGHDRITSDQLEALGLRVVRVDERQVAGAHVSSTTIRRLVEEGNLAEAERLLGHPLGHTALQMTAPPDTAGKTIPAEHTEHAIH